MKQIAILVSGSGTNAQKIIEHFANSDKANISVVISDNSSAYALTRAQNLGIEALALSRADFRNGARPLAELRKRNIDLVILAGFLSGLIGAMGLGGGAVLIIYLAVFTKTEQLTAQGINLLFFIPVGLLAVIIYALKGQIRWKTVLLQLKGSLTKSMRR
jgi:hypothetical protein